MAAASRSAVRMAPSAYGTARVTRPVPCCATAEQSSGRPSLPMARPCRDQHLRLWKVEAPLSGGVAAIRLRAEAAAGLEPGPSGEVRPLDEDAIEERRRLAEIEP